MLQEIEVTATIEKVKGEIIKIKFSDEINANYSRKLIFRTVRSGLYLKYEIKRIESLQIREEAEIYGNV